MNEDRQLNAVEYAIRQWGAVSEVSLPAGIVELFESGFYRRYQQLTDEVVIIMDQHTMSYPFVSENCYDVSGYSAEHIAAKGVQFVLDNLHPEDTFVFTQFPALVLQSISSLSPDDILKCRLSYTYRIRFKDGMYHQVLQHGMVLTIDPNKGIVHMLLILSDISQYKTDARCQYKIVFYPDHKTKKVLLDGSFDASGNLLQSLTARELEVIELTAQGMREADIAQQMGVSLQTIKTHKKNLFHKTGAKNATELVKYSMANFLI